MGRVFDEVREKGREEGGQEGEKKGFERAEIKTAKNLFSFNLYALYLCL